MTAANLRDTLAAQVPGARVLRFGARLLRRFLPLLDVRGTCVVSASADVHEVLARDGELSVVRDNGAKMDALGATFALGMDPSPRYTAEKAWLDASVRAADLPLIRAIVRRHANALLDEAERSGTFDAATGYARSVAARLVEEYFGVRGPDLPTLMRWLRSHFWDLFLDLGNKPAVHARALADAAELAAALRDQLAALRGGGQLPDTVLARMVALGLTDEEARRNITGLVVGAVDTTNKAFCQALDQLLAQPKLLARAEAAARDGNCERVGQFLFEALRFDPHNPIILRHSLQPVRLASGRTIPAGRRVFAFTLAAMFDPDATPEPDAFQPGRAAPDLHFGHGMHRCQGALLNGVVLPELMTALLARGVQRKQRLFGGPRYEGPFPDRFALRLGAKRPRLLTFPPSVDSETSRWILGHHRVLFRERRRSGAGAALTTLRRLAAIPILRDGGKSYSPPRPIAEHLDDAAREERRLVPSDAGLAAEIDRLYARYNGELGRWAAQWVYFYVFQNRPLALRLMTEGVSPRQALLQRMLHPFVVATMKAGLGGLDAAVAAAALEQIRGAFGEVGQRLADGREYLVGDRFSLADLAFCACAAPALLSERYGGALPPLAAMPEEMQREVLRLRDTEAGRWVERMYERHYRPRIS